MKTCPSCHQAPRGPHLYCDTCWQAMQVEWQRAHHGRGADRPSSARGQAKAARIAEATAKALRESRLQLIREADRMVKGRASRERVEGLAKATQTLRGRAA